MITKNNILEQLAILDEGNTLACIHGVEESRELHRLALLGLEVEAVRAREALAKADREQLVEECISRNEAYEKLWRKHYLLEKERDELLEIIARMKA